MGKRSLQLVALGLLVLATILAINVARLPVPPVGAAPAAPLDVDPQAVDRLAAALQIPTVSAHQPALMERAQWLRLHEHLQRSFPRLHRQLQREVINDLSLLYTWPGSDPGLAPIVLLAHQDVVPVEPDTVTRWRYPPFAGVVAEGFIWGRGALDNKSSLLGILEAVEALLAQGFQPQRTVMLAFGHDEEVGGEAGARQMAEVLAERGIQAWFTLDEGSAVTTGVVPGIQRPVAMLNVAEKGYLTLTLSAQGEEGHSSMPPRWTAAGRIAAAVSRLQAQPLPQRLLPEVVSGLQGMAAEMPMLQRVAVANAWLFGPVLRRVMAQARPTDALTRTTQAPTMLIAGVQENVLPTEARAVINFRILPGETVDSVQAHVRRVIADPAVHISRGSMVSDPSPVADPASPAYARITQAIQDTFPTALVVPSLVLAATDNRHYAGVRENGYYFAPLQLGPEDLPRIHGANERIGVDAYLQMIRFYTHLLRHTAGADTGLD